MQSKEPAQQGADIVLVTGATGYVGGRLVPRLLKLGKKVRVLVRDPQRLEARPWTARVQVAHADALRPETLGTAVQGVHTAYYLIHSMMSQEGFRARDEAAARNFGQAAALAGVKHIIYLGGLADPHAELSRHMRSRQLTGAILRQSGVPVTEFRSSMIIGSGSASFEMVRYLTEGLPVLLCPSWVSSRVQPIGIRDVLAYLLAALHRGSERSLTIEIGGADVMEYHQVLQTYARVRGHRRPIVRLPFMHPRLCAAWVAMLTPIPARMARPLIESLRSDSVVRDEAARETFPLIVPAGIETAFRRALLRLETGTVETTWKDALAASGLPSSGRVHVTREGVIVQRVARMVRASRSASYSALTSFGKEDGWRFNSLRWRFHKSAIHGSQSDRGSGELRLGDTVDSWRVETIEPERLICFVADMNLPGRAWTEFELLDSGPNRARLLATAYFAPRGLAGLLYWYLLYPLRTVGLNRMLRRLAQMAEASVRQEP